MVARRYDVNANQVFAWRKLYRDQAVGPIVPRLVPVVVAPERPAGSEGSIEIELDGAVRVRIPTSTGPELAAAIVGALVRR